MKNKAARSTWNQTPVAWGMMLPYLLIFFTFTLLPVLVSIVLSFTDFNLLQMPGFVGINNYIRLFLKDDIFLIAMSNTLVFALITGPVGYILCFIFAWMLNELGPRLRAFLTLLFYAPSMTGSMYIIWRFVLSDDSRGIVNSFLLNMNLISEPIKWLKDTQYMFITVIIVVLWQSIGTSFLVFIAGLQNVDRSYYEAGMMDGIQNRWQELWYVTLPLMRPQLLFGAVMSISGSFNIGAAITALVGFPSTDYAVHTIVHHLEDYGTIRFEMGYASAIATVLFLIMIGSNKLVQKILGGVGK